MSRDEDGGVHLPRLRPRRASSTPRSSPKIAQKEGKMELVREHDFLCNADGVQTIRDDIEKEGVTHICIAACSRRAKTEAFNFPAVAMARANLREGVIWVGRRGQRSTTKSRRRWPTTTCAWAAPN